MKKLSITALALALSSSVFAQVSSYDAFRSQYSTQTSNAAPTTVDSYNFFARIFVTDPYVTSGTLNDASANDHNMTYSSDGTYLGAGGQYSSQAAEEADFADGDYDYTLNGGPHDTDTASLTVGPDDFSTSQPYLTSGSYSALQNLKVNSSVNVTWNNWNDALNQSIHETFFDLVDVTTNTSVLGSSGDSASYTSQLISGSSLKAGDQYRYDLYFSSRLVFGSGITDPSSEFYNAQALTAWDREVSGTFTAQPAPEPITIGLAVASIGAVIRRRRLGRAS